MSTPISISSSASVKFGRPAAGTVHGIRTAVTIADEAVGLLGASAYTSPLANDMPLHFLEFEPYHPHFPAASIKRDSSADA